MRKLVAALACRVTGTRLYGKPVQNLVNGVTILDQLLATLDCLPEIESKVLGISEGVDNQIFGEYARAKGLPYIFGDEIDVLSRLISCGRIEKATDVFRVTTECPFIWTEPFAEVWRRHVENGNDVTVTDDLPEGTAFEIYTLDALEKSHDLGTSWHRSEGCSRYVREHREDFQVEIVKPSAELARMDLRLTVDYPEDLVVCRRVYEKFADKAPLIPLADIVAFLDDNPEIKDLVAPYVSTKRVWPDEPEAG
jgi:spore coat polysaccharide biosynthesis protein SpsF